MRRCRIILHHPRKKAVVSGRRCDRSRVVTVRAEQLTLEDLPRTLQYPFPAAPAERRSPKVQPGLNEEGDGLILCIGSRRRSRCFRLSLRLIRGPGGRTGQITSTFLAEQPWSETPSRPRSQRLAAQVAPAGFFRPRRCPRCGVIQVRRRSPAGLRRLQDDGGPRPRLHEIVETGVAERPLGDLPPLSIRHFLAACLAVHRISLPKRLNVRRSQATTGRRIHPGQPCTALEAPATPRPPCRSRSWKSLRYEQP